MWAFLFIALPAFARPLPLTCEESERFTSGTTDTELARCHVSDAATAPQWALRMAEAMARDGLRPAMKNGPLGPHVAALSETGMVSATFVTAADHFDIWIAEEHFAAHPETPLSLPKGATLVSDQKDDRHHLLTVALQAGMSESAALVDATLSELGAQRLTHQTSHGGEVGHVRWLGKDGMYQIRGAGPRETYLVLFVKQ